MNAAKNIIDFAFKYSEVAEDFKPVETKALAFPVKGKVKLLVREAGNLKNMQIAL